MPKVGKDISSRVLQSGRLSQAGPEGSEPLSCLFTNSDISGERTQSHIFTAK